MIAKLAGFFSSPLGQNPAEINVGDVVRRMESNFKLVECFGAKNTCCLTPVCILRQAINEALSAFLETLDNYTLADLVSPRKGILNQLVSA